MVTTDKLLRGPMRTTICSTTRTFAQRAHYHAQAALPSSQMPSAAPVPGRSVLKLIGRDASKFLKGIVSRDVGETPGHGGYSGFFAANGRVLYDVFIYPILETTSSTSTTTSGQQQLAYLIDHPKTAAESNELLSYIKKFILRSKVRVRDVTEEHEVWSSWGESFYDDVHVRPTWKEGSGGAAEPTWSIADLEAAAASKMSDVKGQAAASAWDFRAGWGREGMGRRHLVRSGDASLTSHRDVLPSSAYDLRRMLLGVPEGSTEIASGSALPLESCMDYMGGIDFRKGCYVGQELTVRTYHTGQTRKRIMPIRLLPPDEAASGKASAGSLPSWPAADATTSRPTAGMAIEYVPAPDAASQKRRPAVRVLSVHPDYAVGLGLMRIELVERVWGLKPWSAGPEPTAASDDHASSGSLEVKEAPGWKVWAGKGRGWYEPPSTATATGDD